MSRAAPELPPRPAIPVTLWCLLAVVCSERLALGASLQAPREALRLAALACAVASAAGLVAIWRLRDARGELWRSALVVLVAALLASWIACLAGLRQQRMRERLLSEAVSGWSITVEGDCSRTDYGYRCRARMDKGSASCLVWLTLGERVSRGTRLRCVGRYREPGTDDFGLSAWRQGICGSVTAVRIVGRADPHGPRWWPERLRAALLASLAPEQSDARALLAGCVCGYRLALDERGLADDFSVLGVAHLIAVSGAHLAIVCELLSRLIAGLELAPRGRLAVLVAGSGLFVLFCGVPASALRAWVMSLVSSGAVLAGRRAHALSSVAVAGMAMALASPAVAGQLGFVLSVTSVCGLALLAPHASYALQVLLPDPRLPRATPRWLWRVCAAALRTVRATLSATLVCQLVTLPLTAAAFGRVSLVAPVANLLLGPAISVVMAYGAACCLAAGVPAVQGALLAVADWAARPLVALVSRMARLPFATLSAEALGPVPGLAVVALMVVWLAWWPRVERRLAQRALAVALVPLLALLVRWRLLAPARIVVLDVGQGDAILVQDGAAAVLVDTGPDDAVVDALARLHVLHLDAVVITHLHDDHYGGLDDLVGAVPCDAVVVARGVAEALGEELAGSCQALTGAEAREVGYGDRLRVGSFALDVIWPTVEVDGDENAESLELLVAYRRHGASLSALLTGDAERDETGACVEAGDVGDIDVLKVGHHGSEVSVTPDILAAIRPEVAVASAGAENPYGHPRPECVAMLEDAGALFLCTKDAGDVELRPQATGVEVRRGRAGNAGGERLDQTL